MHTTEQKTHQKVLDEITYLQTDLAKVLQGIIEQSGSKLKPEGREEVKQKIEATNQLLEYLKSKYSSPK